MKFTKMHGIGNDYVYINCFENTVANAPELARRISDRHKGVGSDGLVLIMPASSTADVRMRMFNSDGSEAEMCGNAIRCVGKYVFERGIARKKELSVETLAGTRHLHLHTRGNRVTGATVDMGRPEWRPKRIPMMLEGETCLEHPLLVGGESYAISCVSMGNPHAVTFVEDIGALPLERIGPLIENHPRFPKKTNVEFAQVLDKKHLRMRVWERGAGETQACGTGACATAVVAARLGLAERDVRIDLAGGQLEIAWGEDDHVRMTGGAVSVFEGEWHENQ